MPNTHILPSIAHEIQAICGDLFPAGILSTTWPEVPPGGGLALAPFETYGYVRDGSPSRLLFVQQPAAGITLSGSDGLYWLALHKNTYDPVTSWTRAPGTHYLWRSNATRPPDPPGGLVMVGVTVAGGRITAVDTAVTGTPRGKVAYGGATGSLAYARNLVWDETLQRLGVGFPSPGATLDVNGVGHSWSWLVNNRAGDSVVAFHTGLMAAGGTNRWAIYCGGDAPSRIGGSLSVQNLTSDTNVYAAGRVYAQNGLRVYGGIGIEGEPQPGWALYSHTSAPTYFPGAVGIGVAPSQALDVNGVAWIRSNLTVSGVSGFGGAADGRFSLRCYSTAYFDGVVNMASEAGHRLNVGGNAYITGLLGVGTAPYGGWNIAAGSILCWNNMQTNGSLYIVGGSTFQSHVQANSTMSVAGTLRATSYFVSHLEAGFGMEAMAGWSLSAAGSIYCAAGLQAGSIHCLGNILSNTIGTNAFSCTTLYAAQTGHFASCVGIQRAPDGNYGLVVQGSILTPSNMHCSGTYYGGNFSGVYLGVANTDISNQMYVGGIVGLAIPPGHEGYGFHCAHSAKFRSVMQIDQETGIEVARMPGWSLATGRGIHCSGGAVKPGGGPWGDSSSRTLKRDIAPIPDALGLLLAQQGRQFVWTEPAHASLLPGLQYGLVLEEVTLPQWLEKAPGDTEPSLVGARGFEALAIEALRSIDNRLKMLEEAA